MSRPKIAALEYIRGIAMLGVIGIHTGAYSLSNPEVNIHLFAWFEIFTRFSVPIFFFVSAFGLFLNLDLFAPFNYRGFMYRRYRSVIIPYIVWSLLYMLYDTLITGNFAIWSFASVFACFFYGIASYHLYFLVILIWFYILMPLWIAMLKKILLYPKFSLSSLLLFQILFNYYSCYILNVHIANYFLAQAIDLRLNYWVAHYIFTFMFGAFCAAKYDAFKQWITQRTKWIYWFFFTTLAGMFSFYYYLLYNVHYTPEEAVNTAHQLSPIGVLYTLAACLFWFSVFDGDLPSPIKKFLASLGRHSYLVYLLHPFTMYFLANYYHSHAIVMTSFFTILFYLSTVLISLIASSFIKTLGQRVPGVSLLLQGQSLKA
jgi:surface polysaccharide O-acyltransferase-like enzyme